MTRPRIFFVNRFYWPDEPATAQLLGDLAEAFAAAGHYVTVITSHPGKNCPAEELRNGVRIVRVRSLRGGRQGVWTRLPALVGFLCGALRTLSTLARAGDIVIPLTDPPLIGVAVQTLATSKRWRVIHWVQDIYPEVAMTVGGARWLGGLRSWRDRAWCDAQACVVLGTDMSDFLESRGVPDHKLQVIPNWAPRGLRPTAATNVAGVRKNWDVADRLVVMYSGNLGRVHDLEPVLSVAARLADEPRIVFIFVGGGARKNALQTRVAELKLTNVQFQPHQPRELLAATLSAGDVHLVTLHPACASLVFPSKLYGIAAIGRPVLFIGPTNSEIARIVHTEELGATFDRDEIEKLVDTLRQWSRDPARIQEYGCKTETFALRTAQSTQAAEAWLKLINQLAKPGAEPLSHARRATL